MSTSQHPFLVLSILIVTHGIINAQSEELFYSFGFVQSSDSNWTENNGSSFNAAVHDYAPVFWRTNIACPRASSGDNTCIHLRYDAFITRIIPTTGYHSIRLQIDVYARDVEIGTDDWCIVQYRTETITWQNVNVVQGQDEYALDFAITIPDTSSYNNQESFEVKVGIDANTGGDNCYYDNLRMFGIPYTANPSANPSATPSKRPSFNPSQFPSESTFQPSRIPSAHPSADPSTHPSRNPSKYPTVQPTTLTITPTENPTRIPSVHPSIYPSATPSATPSQFPSKYPSVQPSRALNPTLSLILSVDPTETSSDFTSTLTVSFEETQEMERTMAMPWTMAALVGGAVCICLCLSCACYWWNIHKTIKQMSNNEDVKQDVTMVKTVRNVECITRCDSGTDDDEILEVVDKTIGWMQEQE
eukprot:370762_1